MLYIASLIIVGVSNWLSPDFDMLILIAALVGATNLILAAKGTVWSPVVGIVFCVLYAVISFRFRYWGEMITYIGMDLPMCAWTVISWIRNPSKADANSVEIARMSLRKWLMLSAGTLLVTGIFYFVLRALDTPNLLVSTISIATSFAASGLMVLRSPSYAILFSLNDIVLIVLWVLATLKDPVYFPVIVNFGIFLINDIYGYVSWKKREHAQKIC